MTEAKKRGRPPKPKAERAVSVNFTMRLRPRLMEELRQSAEASDLTISAEAERRLSQPEIGEIGRAVGAALATVERRSGASWNSSDDMRERCRIAADAVLNVLLGPAPSIEALLGNTKAEARHRDQADQGGSGILSLLISNTAPSRDDLQKSIDRIQGLIDAQGAGHEAAKSGIS